MAPQLSRSPRDLFYTRFTPKMTLAKSFGLVIILMSSSLSAATSIYNDTDRISPGQPGLPSPNNQTEANLTAARPTVCSDAKTGAIRTQPEPVSSLAHFSASGAETQRGQGILNETLRNKGTSESSVVQNLGPITAQKVIETLSSQAGGATSPAPNKPSQALVHVRNDSNIEPTAHIKGLKASDIMGNQSPPVGASQLSHLSNATRSRRMAPSADAKPDGTKVSGSSKHSTGSFHSNQSTGTLEKLLHMQNPAGQVVLNGLKQDAAGNSSPKSDSSAHNEASAGAVPGHATLSATSFHVSAPNVRHNGSSIVTPHNGSASNLPKNASKPTPVYNATAPVEPMNVSAPIALQELPGLARPKDLPAHDSSDESHARDASHDASRNGSSPKELSAPTASSIISGLAVPQKLSLSKSLPSSIVPRNVPGPAAPEIVSTLAGALAQGPSTPTSLLSPTISQDSPILTTVHPSTALQDLPVLAGAQMSASPVSVPVSVSTSNVSGLNSSVSLQPLALPEDLPALVAVQVPSFTPSEAKPSPTTTEVKQSISTSEVNPSPTTTEVKQSVTTSEVIPSPTTTEVKQSVTPSEVIPSPTTTEKKQSDTTSEVKPSPTTTEVEQSITTSEVKPSLTATEVKPPPTTSEVKPSPTELIESSASSNPKDAPDGPLLGESNGDFTSETSTDVEDATNEPSGSPQVGTTLISTQLDDTTTDISATETDVPTPHETIDESTITDDVVADKMPIPRTHQRAESTTVVKGGPNALLVAASAAHMDSSHNGANLSSRNGPIMTILTIVFLAVL